MGFEPKSFSKWGVWGLLGMLVFSVVLAGLSSQARGSSARKKVKLLISVDWEGEDLRDANLKAMKKFRQAFPEVKLLHFLNAAYFTKQDADVDQVARKIHSVILPQDEVGVHLHGWKSLIEAAGVKFRAGPQFDGGSVKKSECEDEDCGFDVMIGSYSTAELTAILKKSREILKKNGFGPLRAFRAGAWMGTPNVLEAVAASGFKIDSSAVATELVEEDLSGTAGFNVLKKTWKEIDVISQPYEIKTRQGVLEEIPDNGALADYVDSRTMLKVFKENISEQSQVLVQFGFHEETAADYLEKLENGLTKINEFCTEEEISLEYW